MTTLAGHAGSLVESRLHEFTAASQELDAKGSTPENLHALRIAGKKLRYAIELVEEILPDARAPLRTLAEMQEVLGILHDADVGLTRLADPPGSVAARKWLAQRLTASRRSALAAWSRDFPEPVRRRLVARVRRAVKSGA